MTERLSSMPYIGMQSEKNPAVRRVLITPEVSLYYSVQSPLVFLHQFMDNRQNPAQNPC